MSEGLIYNNSKWFFFTMLYLVVDYARPQDIVPALNYIKPGMLMTILLTAFLFFQGNLRKVDSKQTRMMYFFILLLALYVPFAVNNYYAYLTVKSMLLFMPFILSAIICINSMERLRTTILILISIMIYIALYSLWHKGVGSGGYFQDENDLALFINMWLPFCFCLFFTEKERMKKIFYGAGFILGLVSVMVSFSRGGFVGLLAMSFFLWIFSPRKIITLSIISIIAIVIFIFGSQAYWKEMSTVTDTHEDTASARLLSWHSAWDMFLDNPLGVGGNNFQVRFPEYQSDRFSRVMWGRVAHSLWLTLISETGILGIIIYLMLLYYNLKDIFYLKRINQESTDPQSRYLYFLSLALLASLAGFFVSATFISVLYYPHYWYLSAIIIAVVNITKNNMIMPKPTIVLSS
jgi:O-antigen ligase